MHERWARPTTPLPTTIPVFPLSGAILLPRGQLPLQIFEPRYLAMIDDALKGDRIIGIVQPAGDGQDMRQPELYSIGGMGRITSLAETDDNRYLITLTGISRFQIQSEVPANTPYRQAVVSYERFAADRARQSDGSEIDRETLLEALRRYFTVNAIDSDWDSIEHAPSEALVNSLSMIAPVEPAEKQALLEAPTLGERARILVALIELSLATATDEMDHKPN